MNIHTDEINKVDLIASIREYFIENESTIEETRLKARELAMFYFPKASEIFIEEFVLFAVEFQQYYYAQQDFELAFKEYKKQKEQTK